MADHLGDPPATCTVLVIDDNAWVRTTVATILMPHGYRVLEAASGEEGLHILAARQEVAAVVLDLQMPRMDGEQVLAAIRARDATLPVVILSGALDPDRASELTSAGASVCLNKVDAATGLAAALRRALAAPEPHPRR